MRWVYLQYVRMHRQGDSVTRPSCWTRVSYLRTHSTYPASIALARVFLPRIGQKSGMQLERVGQWKRMERVEERVVVLW